MLKVGLDASILTGVPVSGGPQVEISNTNDRKVKYNGSSDYVFAYRVAKIQLRKDGDVKGYDDFTKEALFNTDEANEDRVDSSVGDWVMNEIIISSEELEGSEILSGIDENEEEVVLVISKPR